MNINENLKEFRQLSIIAIPLLVQQIGSMLISIGDQALIGRISIEAFNGIGIVSSMLSILIGIVGYAGIVFNIKGTKAKAEGNDNEYYSQFIEGFILSLFISFPLVLIFFISGKDILRLIYGISGLTLDEAWTYLRIMVISIPVQLLMFTYGAIFKIEKKTTKIMYSSILCATLNVALDYLLIFGKFGFPKLDTLGAAIGSAISICTNLMIYVILSRGYIKYDFTKPELIIKGMLYNLRTMIPFMGQEILEGSIFGILVTAILSRMGPLILGTYNILMQLVGISTMAMYMYGTALLTCLSEAMGKKSLKSLRSLPINSIILSEIFYIIIFLIFVFNRSKVGYIYTTNIELIRSVKYTIFWTFIAYLLNAFETIYRYALQTIGKASKVLYTSFFVNIISILLIYLFSSLINMGIYSVLLVNFLKSILLIIMYGKSYNKHILNNQFNSLDVEKLHTVTKNENV